MLKATLIVLVLIGFAAALPDFLDFTSEESSEWLQFLARNRKSFNNLSTYRVRQREFLRNFRRIREHKRLFALGKLSWDVKLYNHSDLSRDEFIKTHCGINRKFSSNTSTPVVTLGPQVRATPPTTWDIRTQGPGKLNTIKDQQQCGSCWAFATSAAIENTYSAKYGSLPSLSEQQQVDCNKQCSACDGCWFDQAFTYSKSGLTSETKYPYIGYEQTCKSATTVSAKNTNYVVLAQDDATIQNYISTKGACAVCVDASGWDTYSSGIYAGAGSNPECNHAVVIVGYGSGYWLIRNSWGTTFGEAGYIRVQNSVAGGIFKDTVYCPIV